MIKYDLCIATCGPHKRIVDCLQFIRRHSQDYRVLWLDNGAPEDVRAAAMKELEAMPHLAVYSPENIGTIKGYNVLFALSTAPYIVTMNDDIEVVDGWLEGMRRLFEIPGVGMSACAVTEGGKLTASSLGAPRDGHLFLDGLPTFCAMISRECFTRVGYLDDGLAHLSLGDDDEWNCRARKLGYKFVVDLRTVVQHHHQASSLPMMGGAEEKRKKHLAAAEYIRRKHGV